MENHVRAVGQAGFGSTGVCWSSIDRPQGSVVGRPKSSWLNQLPQRPSACATSTPGAIASRTGNSLIPLRFAQMTAPTAPSAIAPQTPRPPCQT